MNGQCTVVAFTMWALVLKMPTLFFHSLLWKKGAYMSVPAPSPPEWSKTWLAVKCTTVVIRAFVILSLSYFLLTKGPSSNQIGSLPQNWHESRSFYFNATHLSFWSKYICTQHRSNSIFKAILTESKGEMDWHTIREEHVNTPLSTLDRSSREKIKFKRKQ